NPRVPKHSWRDDKAAGRGGAGQRDWHKEQEGGGKGPRFTRRGKILLAGGLFTAGLITLLIVIFWPRKIDPPRLVIIEADYAANLAVPPNVQGVQAMNDLRDWAAVSNKERGGDPAEGIEVKREVLTRDADPLAAALDNCNSKKVAVFLALHGGAD